MKGAPFLRASFFVWLAVPAAMIAIFLTAGLPYALWSYEWQGSTSAAGRAARYHTRCTYLGPHGAITRPAPNGRCAWVRFFKMPGGG